MKEIVLTKAAGGAKKRSDLLKLRSYNAWRGLLERCNNPNHQYFHYYGGAGIKVCERWKKYAAFLEDMGEPEQNMQIDRIDPDKDYGPENCRWATPSQNCANRRGWSKSGYKGISQRPSGRYAAVMRVAGKTVTIGTFDDAETAARAYDAAAKKRFGEFARTNADMGKVVP